MGDPYQILTSIYEPLYGGYCDGRSLYLCYLSFLFWAEVSVAQSVETPYIAMQGDVATSVRVRIPRPI